MDWPTIIAVTCLALAVLGAMALGYWVRSTMPLVEVEDEVLTESRLPPAPTPAPGPANTPVASRPPPGRFPVLLNPRGAAPIRVTVPRRGHRIIVNGRAWDHYGEVRTDGTWIYTEADGPTMRQRQQLKRRGLQ